MSELQDLGCDFKIAPEDSLSIIGSNSINTSGDLYTIDINSIGSPRNLRNKRFLDIVSSLALLILLPLNLFLVKNPPGLLKNIFMVFFAQRSWVGYNTKDQAELDKLPHIKKGILNPEDAFTKKKLNKDITGKLDLIYARDYNFTADINIILKAYRKLGRI
jgi:lipopolysaccharide/colanic/teichoic acid biosynthesis glycosyltransferase